MRMEILNTMNGKMETVNVFRGNILDALFRSHLLGFRPIAKMTSALNIVEEFNSTDVVSHNHFVIVILPN